MANSRMFLTCKHCGKQLFLAKGYYGGYGTRCGKHGGITTYEEYVDRLEDFFDHHGGNCKKATHTEDNARDHYIILEECECFDYEEYGKTGEEIILRVYNYLGFNEGSENIDIRITPEKISLTDEEKFDRLYYDDIEICK